MKKKEKKILQFLSELLVLSETSISVKLQWIDIMAMSFFTYKDDEIFLDKRNAPWLPKIKESID